MHVGQLPTESQDSVNVQMPFWWSKVKSMQRSLAAHFVWQSFMSLAITLVMLRPWQRPKKKNVAYNTICLVY